MNEQHPDQTVSPIAKQTDTQRFQPITRPTQEIDPNKTHPNIVVREFPKGSAHAPELPPSSEVVSRPQVGETRIYEGSLKLVVTRVHENGGFDGVDGYGIPYSVAAKDEENFRLAEADDNELST